MASPNLTGGHAPDCDYHCDQVPQECTCAIGRLQMLHDAMATIMEKRRLSEGQRERDEAYAAIAIWRDTERFLREQSNG